MDEHSDIDDLLRRAQAGEEPALNQLCAYSLGWLSEWGHRRLPDKTRVGDQRQKENQGRKEFHRLASYCRKPYTNSALPAAIETYCFPVELPASLQQDAEVVSILDLSIRTSFQYHIVESIGDPDAKHPDVGHAR